MKENHKVINFFSKILFLSMTKVFPLFVFDETWKFLKFQGADFKYDNSSINCNPKIPK